MRQKKEYGIICGLALADGLNGFATLYAGAYRMLLRLTGTAFETVSTWYCFFMPHNFVWTIADNLMPCFLLIVSIDRLICVWKPLKYFKYTTRYSNCLAGIGYTYGMGTFLAAVSLHFFHLEQNGSVKRICYYSFGHSPAFMAYSSVAKILMAIASVILYGVVLLVYRNFARTQIVAINMNKGGTNALEKRYEQNQKRMTVSLGISCALTLAFYVFPTTLMYIMRSLLKIEANNFFMSLYMISNLNAVFNLIILLKRQKVVRQSLGPL